MYVFEPEFTSGIKDVACVDLHVIYRSRVAVLNRIRVWFHVLRIE